MGFQGKQLRAVLEKGAEIFLASYPKHLHQGVSVNCRNIMSAASLDFPSEEAARNLIQFRLESPVQFQLPNQS